MTQETPSPLSERLTTAAPRGDLGRLKEHGGASIAELKEFVKNLHGRSPGEVLGIVSASSLIRSLVEATVWLAIVIVILTIVPYWMKGDKPTKAAATQAAATEAAPSADPAASVLPPDATGSGETVSDANAQKAVDIMGLGDTKMADPNKNPLDNLDNLLDDVK